MKGAILNSFDEYAKLTKETAIYPNVGSNPVYPALGLGGEAGEVAGHLYSGDDLLIKELGDVLWYVARLAEELNFSPEWKQRQPGSVEWDKACLIIMQGVGQVQEAIKKVIRDKGGEFDEDSVNKVKAGVSVVMEGVAVLAAKLNLDVLEIAQRNLDKLRSRKERNLIGGSGDNR